MSKIGFIGLGIMGRPMATNLQAAGHTLFLHDRSALPVKLLEGGAVGCASGREVAEKTEIVILMVPDTPDVEGGQNRCRYELDLADRDQGVCQAHQRAWL
jgi:2-hydroxy-3-oxopropionate reductase